MFILKVSSLTYHQILINTLTTLLYTHTHIHSRTHTHSPSISPPCSYLLDYLINRMRKTAYGNILKGFQNFSILDIKKDFAFHSIQDCFEFLKEHNAIYIQMINPITQKTENQIDCKASIIGSNRFFPCSTTSTGSITTSSTSLPFSKHDSKALSSSRNSNIVNHNGKKSKHGKNERNERNGKSEKNGKNGKHENGNRNVISVNRTVIQPSSSSSTTSNVIPHQINGLTSKSHSSSCSNSGNSGSSSNDRRQVNLVTRNEVEDSSVVTKRKGGSKRGNVILFDDVKKDENHTHVKIKQRKIELILS